MLPCQINGFMYLDPVRLNHHLKSQLIGRKDDVIFGDLSLRNVDTTQAVVMVMCTGDSSHSNTTTLPGKCL